MSEPAAPAPTCWLLRFMRNAALREIVRRDSGETYRRMLHRMAEESGIATPTADDLFRLGRARKTRSSRTTTEPLRSTPTPASPR